MELSANEYDVLRSYIFEESGINLGADKQYLVQQRLEPIVKMLRLNTFKDLVESILADVGMQLRDQIIAAITTNETSFFRDRHPFDAFSEYVLPELGSMVRERKQGNDQRKGAKVSIWCAASSTGQEPYSLAILIDEYVKKNLYSGLSREDFQILATDISSEILSRAIAGKYSDFEISRGLSIERRSEYFTKEGDFWHLNDDIQSMVDFRKLNLNSSFTMLGGFDLIFCRNVLIYFDDNSKREIYRQFHQMLSSEGLLVLGACESLTGLSDDFQSERYNETIIYKARKLT